jgi:hypothetical protein
MGYKLGGIVPCHEPEVTVVTWDVIGRQVQCVWGNLLPSLVLINQITGRHVPGDTTLQTSRRHNFRFL